MSLLAVSDPEKEKEKITILILCLESKCKNGCFESSITFTMRKYWLLGKFTSSLFMCDPNEQVLSYPPSPFSRSHVHSSDLRQTWLCRLRCLGDPGWHRVGVLALAAAGAVFCGVCACVAFWVILRSRLVCQHRYRSH